MHATAVLDDAVTRIPDLFRAALDGISPAALVTRLDPAANTLAWLAWHAGREQDSQLSALAGTQEVWTAQGWAARAGLALPDSDMGYGHTAEQVALVDAPADLLLGYLEAVCAAAQGYLADLSDDDLDEIVDTRWDPPVTRGARLVSIAGDALEHAGQAAFLRGVLDRTN